MKRIYAGGWIVTCDEAGTEHPAGWLLVEDGVVGAVGAGDEPDADERVELSGAVVTPGLVNSISKLLKSPRVAPTSRPSGAFFGGAPK